MERFVVIARTEGKEWVEAVFTGAGAEGRAVDACVVQNRMAAPEHLTTFRVCAGRQVPRALRAQARRARRVIQRAAS